MSWSENVISFSGMQKLRACPRLFYYESELKIERVKQVEGDTRRVGNIFHAGMEGWWTTPVHDGSPWHKVDEALVEALKNIDAKCIEAQATIYERAMNRALLIGYHARWADLEFTTIAAEGWKRVDLVDPDGKPVTGWKLVLRKDVHIEMDGQELLVEHKSSSADIGPGTQYWEKLAMDGQISAYLDAERLTGSNMREILWDVARKPDLDPHLATPEEKRRYTKGDGCRLCGGKAGVKGTGSYIKKYADVSDGSVIEEMLEEGKCRVRCGACKGNGWKDEPTLYANQRSEDESAVDYEQRLLATIAENPDKFYRQAMVPRTDRQLAESRADMVSAVCEIDGMRKRSKQSSEPVRAWPRNTQNCFSYGRRCDFFEVCSGQASIDDMTLYQVRPRGGQRK